MPTRVHKKRVHKRKRPLNGFVKFMEYHKLRPGRAAGARWRALSMAEKERWKHRRV